MTDYQNRIVSYEPCVDPEQLLGHPENWRIHPLAQQKALKGSLQQIGWIDTVTVNVNTQHVVDGHLRAAEAISAESCCPVIFVDITEEEELVALSSFDTITGMAVTDSDTLARIADRVTYQSDALADAVRSAISNVIRDAPDPNTDADGALGPDDDATPQSGESLSWGWLGWKTVRVNCSETEVSKLNELYEAYRDDNGGLDIGFVRWLVEQAE